MPGHGIFAAESPRGEKATSWARVPPFRRKEPKRNTMNTIVLATILSVSSPLQPSSFSEGPAVQERLERVLPLFRGTSQGFQEFIGPRGSFHLFANGGVAGPEGFSAEMEGILAAFDQSLGKGSDGTEMMICLLDSQEGMKRVCGMLGEALPEQQDYLAACADQPNFILYEPPIAVFVRDPEQPEDHLSHAMVHGGMQIAIENRYGLLPLWLSEGLACVGEDHMDGRVLANWYRKGPVDADRMEWRDEETRSLVSRAGDLLPRLVSYRAQDYDETLARLAYAFAAYAWEEVPERLNTLCRSLADLRQRTFHGGPFFEPDAGQVRALVEEAFGKDLEGALVGWWKTTELHPKHQARPLPGAKILLCLESVFAEKSRGCRKMESKDGRLVLYSDRTRGQCKKTLKAAMQALERTDWALGPLSETPPQPIHAVVLRDRDRYQALCAAIGEAAPHYAKSMEEAAKAPGFTLFVPPLVVALEDPSGETVNAVHMLAHGLAAVEIQQRYGRLPLWLADGMATVAEESIDGQVWTNWGRSGFVSTESHGSWRGLPTRSLFRDGMPSLRGFAGAAGNVYDDGRAHLAFAIAAFGMEKRPAALRNFCRSVARLGRASLSANGRPELGAEELEGAFLSCFGEGGIQELVKYWKHPLSWRSANRAAKKNGGSGRRKS